MSNSVSAPPTSVQHYWTAGVSAIGLRYRCASSTGRQRPTSACVDPELKEAPVLDLKSLDIDQRWLAASPILLQDIDHMIMEVNMECFEVLQIVNPTSLAIY